MGESLATGQELGKEGAHAASDITESIAKGIEHTQHVSEAALKSLEQAGRGLHATSVAISGINFLRIPYLYLTAYLKGEPVLFTLSNNAKWALSALILALSIVGIAVPPLGAVMALSIASVMLAVDVFHLGKYVHTLLAARSRAQEAHATVQRLNATALDCQDQIDTLQQTPTAGTENKEKIAVLEQKQAAIAQALAAKKQVAAELTQAYETVQQKKSIVYQRAMAIGIGALLIIGTAVLIAAAASPAGPAIMATAATIGAAYAVGKFAVPFIYKKIQQRKLKKQATKTAAIATEPEPETPQPAPELTNTHSLESTAKLMRGLYGKQAQKNLENIVCNTHKMQQMDRHLELLIDNKDLHGILEFFNHALQNNLCRNTATLKYANTFLKNLKNAPQAIDLLQQAMIEVKQEKITLSPTAKTSFQTESPLKTLLCQRGVDFSAVMPEEEEEEGGSEGAKAAQTKTIALQL